MENQALSGSSDVSKVFIRSLGVRINVLSGVSSIPLGIPTKKQCQNFFWKDNTLQHGFNLPRPTK